LYGKPDDRWEVNDVADRCPEVVERLSAALDEAVLRPAGAAITPLDDILLSGFD